MKIQKQLSKRTKNKDYYRYVLNIPSLIVREAGFDENSNLKPFVKDGKIIIQRENDK